MSKTLFFGRQGCKASEKACNFLASNGFDVKTVFSRGLGEKLPEDIKNWKGDYIFCFRSYFILPLRLIKNAKKAAVNFHPGPPEYPGSGCLNFALYDNAEEYGVTASLMNEKVDNGKIIKAVRFPVFTDDNVETLLSRTHGHLTDLFLNITGGIAEDPEFLDNNLSASQGETWKGRVRKMKVLDEYQNVGADITEDELKRRIRAFHTSAYPLQCVLHGVRFELAKI